MRCRLALLILAAASIAPAQTIPLALARDTVPAAHAAHYPKPSTATWLSVGATLVPVGAGLIIKANASTSVAENVAFTGLLIGPAAGFWYGGVSGKASPGLLIRSGGLLIYEIASNCSGSCSQSEQIIRGGGVAIMVASAIYDIATVGKKVQANNAAAARAMIVPLFSPSDRSVGVEIVVGF